jgi:nicotinamidase-related amidase
LVHVGCSLDGACSGSRRFSPRLRRTVRAGATREGTGGSWIQHSDDELAHGSDGWQIVSALAPGDAEPLVEKNYGDAFEDTTLGR